MINYYDTLNALTKIVFSQSQEDCEKSLNEFVILTILRTQNSVFVRQNFFSYSSKPYTLVFSPYSSLYCRLGDLGFF